MKRLYTYHIICTVICLFVMSCNTESSKLPEVTTGEAEILSDGYSVRCSGEVLADGGSVVFERGICYISGESTPTITDKHISAGSGRGYFTAVLNIIEPGNYTYCAFATNSAGTSYGEPLTFTISSGNPIENEEEQQPDGEYITVARAIEIANALPESTYSDRNYKVRGVVVQVMTQADKIPNVFTDINLKIKDSTGEMDSYYTNYIGNTPFTSASQIPAVGTEVVIEGPLYKYVSNAGKTNPEFSHAWFAYIDEESNKSQEPQGNYLMVGDKITTLSYATYEMVYTYAVNPAYYTYTYLKFFDDSNKIAFNVAGGSYSTISSLPIGSWYFLESRTYDTNVYWAWNCPAISSLGKYVSFTSFVVKQNGNTYTIDCIINETAKMHYEGAVQHSTSVNNTN